MITTLPGAQYAKPGSAGTPIPGIDAAVLDEEGNEVPNGTQGLLALRRPWPGMLRTLFQDDERFVETYFSKWGKETYLVGDASRRDEDDGYFWVIGRVDDVLNVSGHRMSTAEIESAIVSHPKVAESAVIGQADEDTGQSVCAFVTIEGDEDEGSEALIEEIRERVADRIGKFARPKRIIWAGDLPKTRSGQDHAPTAARHRRGARARRRDHPARPRRDGQARGQGQGAPVRGGLRRRTRVPQRAADVLARGGPFRQSRWAAGPRATVRQTATGREATRPTPARARRPRTTTTSSSRWPGASRPRASSSSARPVTTGPSGPAGARRRRAPGRRGAGAPSSAPRR